MAMAKELLGDLRVGSGSGGGGHCFKVKMVRCSAAVHEAAPPTAVDFGFREKVVALTSLKLCLSQAGHFDYGGGRAGWTRSILCLKQPAAVSSGSWRASTSRRRQRRVVGKRLI